eukprot:scaffold57078_cov60-Phaeocystis_antarctica.AAC.2
MPSSTRAAAPACRRAEALEVRYRAAAGVGEEAHSRQPHWCPWSKPMNVETCGRHVADLIVMAHAFAELRDGVVARQQASTKNGFKCGHNFAQTLYDSGAWDVVLAPRDAVPDAPACSRELIS